MTDKYRAIVRGSVDKLFAEEFTPTWMHRRVIELVNMDAEQKAVMEFNYRQFARERVREISTKHKPRHAII